LLAAFPALVDRSYMKV